MEFENATVPEAHHSPDAHEHPDMHLHGAGHARIGDDEYPFEWGASTHGDAKTKELGNSDNMGEGFDSGLLAGLLGNRRDNDDLGLIAAMMANKGIDPGIVAMLNDRCRNGDGWGDGNGWWIILLFLFMMMGWGNNGWNNGANGVEGVDRTVVNEANYSRLMDAISTQGTRQEMAISQLAQTLNCDNNAIRSALCGLDKQLALTQGDIKSAIQNCCCTLRTEMQALASGINQNVTAGTCAIQSDIAGLNYNLASQFAASNYNIQQLFCQQNQYLASAFGAIKEREDAREIQALRDKLEEAQANARMTAIIAEVRGMNTLTGTVDQTTGVINNGLIS